MGQGIIHHLSLHLRYTLRTTRSKSKLMRKFSKSRREEGRNKEDKDRIIAYIDSLIASPLLTASTEPTESQQDRVPK